MAYSCYHGLAAAIPRSHWAVVGAAALAAATVLHLQLPSVAGRARGGASGELSGQGINFGVLGMNLLIERVSIMFCMQTKRVPSNTKQPE